MPIGAELVSRFCGGAKINWLNRQSHCIFHRFHKRLNRILSFPEGALCHFISRNLCHCFSRWVSRTGSMSPTDSTSCCVETFEDESGAPSVEGLNGTESRGWSGLLAASRRGVWASIADAWAWVFFLCLLRRSRGWRIGATSPTDSSGYCPETFEGKLRPVSGKAVCTSTAFPAALAISTSSP